MVYIIKRTIAYFIDCIICYSVIILVLQWAIMSNLRTHFGTTNEWFKNSLNLELYVLLSISLPVWTYFIYFDSVKANGTFGKRVMKLMVLNYQNSKIRIRQSFLRTFLKLLPWEIAHAGVIFPTPLYFAKDADVRFLTIIGIFLFIIYFISIIGSTKRQSLYDKLLKTMVIEK